MEQIKKAGAIFRKSNIPAAFLSAHF